MQVLLRMVSPNETIVSFGMTIAGEKKAGSRGTGLRCFLVGQGGVEPPTLGFSVLEICSSTDQQTVFYDYEINGLLLVTDMA